MLSSTIPLILRGSTLSAWSSCKSSWRSSLSAPKILNHLFEIPARSVRLPCSFSQKPSNSHRHGIPCRVRRELLIQRVLETPGLRKLRHDMGPTCLLVAVAHRLGIQSPPIPNITVCSSISCKNSGGNFVAIVTVWMGLLAKACVSGVIRRPVARKAANNSISLSSHETELCFAVPLSGASRGDGR